MDETNRKHLLDLDVAGITYTVYEDDLHQLGGYGELGYCDYMTQTIVVQYDVPMQRKAQTIIHELLHAMFLETGYDEHDEDMINRLGITLTPIVLGGELEKIREFANKDEESAGE